jgi:YidC/Oxa1 family membrane protein insertase
VFDFLGTIGGAIMAPLYFLTSLVLSGWHSVFGAIFGSDSGVAWALSIIGLTLVIRAALIPLFVKQIKSSRNMQLLQPRVKELQKKYGHDKERLAQEQMKLYKDTGTNPLASCLPLLVQMPIFIALFRCIDRAAKGQTRGVLTQTQVDSLSQAKLFGARIADTFTGAAGDSATHVRVLAAVLVVAMTATTFLTQRQLMTKNMPADALTGQYAQQQKMLLYVLPLVFAVGGIAFPIGVLIYWTTSNLWTMSQQFYVIRNNPAPGTPAAAAKEKRVAERGGRTSAAPTGTATATGTATDTAPGPGATAANPPRRQQPKKTSREQRKKTRPPTPGKADPAEGGSTHG